MTDQLLEKQYFDSSGGLISDPSRAVAMTLTTTEQTIYKIAQDKYNKIFDPKKDNLEDKDFTNSPKFLLREVSENKFNHYFGFLKNDLHSTKLLVERMT